MIREMKHEFEGIEFYRSTFNVVTGDLVRITEEPPPPRMSYSYSSDEWTRIQDYVQRRLMKNSDRWDYKSFHKAWDDRYGARSFRGLAWSPSPETIDIKINDWCDFGCPYCYMNSKKTTKGEMGVEKLVSILKSFNPLPYQVAFGGGEPTAHSDFVNVLKSTRELGIVPNFTTAGHMWTQEIVDAANEYCGGIAVTYHAFKGIEWFGKMYKQWKNSFKKQLNVHLIADATIVENLNALVQLQSEVGPIKLVLLAYYPDVGRANLKGLMDKQTYMEALPLALNKAVESGMKISFSEGLIPYFISRPNIKVNTSMAMPQEGRFSCYIDSKGRMGVSSFDNDRMKEFEKKAPPDDFNYQRAWHELYFHNQPSGDACSTCKFQKRCSTPNIHHYLICSYAPHNGGTGNRLPSWMDVMRAEEAAKEAAEAKTAPPVGEFLEAIIKEGQNQ